jgi:protein-S-isoprenylcysteine O-methyltransferase Ste14
MLRNFILGCWIVFAVYWAAAAISTKRTIERQSWKSRRLYVLLLVLAFLLLFRLVPAYPLNIRVLPVALGLDVAAALLCIGGLALAIWARRTIGRNWSGVVTLKRDHELVTGGPYRYVRHPIYSAILLMFVASALASGRVDGFIGFALCVASFWVKLRQEEALMARHFPEQYAAYRASVKALVPFLF